MPSNQPSNIVFHAAIESKAEFCDRFIKFVRSYEGTPVGVRISLRPSEVIFDKVIKDDTDEDFVEAIERLRSTNAVLLDNVSFYTRINGNNKQGTLRFWLDESTGYSVPVSFTNNDHITADALAKLDSAFDLRSAEEAVAIRIPEIADNRFAAYQDAIVALKETAASLAELQAKAIVDNTEFINKATSGLAEKLNAEREKNFEEAREKQVEIDAQRVEIAKERAELNLRESRKVRRDLLEKMETLVEKQAGFERSDETKGSDRAIWISVAVLCLVGAIIAGASLTLLGMQKIESSTFYPAFVSGMLLLGSNAFVLVWYAMKKNRKHADTDFAIMQYSRDMYRMSWITELLFESQSNTVGDERIPVEIPETILEQFAHSLFADSADGASHPLDELQRYARRFKKFSISSKGVDAEVDKP
jgi:uncharacterized membrane protein YeaQ/YmgE (transglycosylase-associated protein family)